MNGTDNEVQLAQALIRAPSPSGRESPAAAVLRGALEELAFDEVVIDGAGNVVGTMRGRAGGPTVMLNGHLDTVPVGDESLWPHPPLSGAVADGRLWGRGACDMKAALACMALAASDVRAAGFRGTLMVSGVVQEEVGGIGAHHMASERRADLVLLGEPSNLRLMFGHRGVVELHVTLPGRIAHAARAELGENALSRAAAFIRALERLELPAGGPLGRSSATPTRLSTFPPDGKNVVPGRADLTIDYRNLPDDPPGQALARVRALDPGAEVEIPEIERVSESGELRRRAPHVVRPYLAPRDHPLVAPVRDALRGVLSAEGRALGEGYWWFCTDAPELATMAPVVLGFGPGEEELAHTTRESVPLEHLRLARRAYAAVALALLC
jgi:putative selenium metabolism hydrolase